MKIHLDAGFLYAMIKLDDDEVRTCTLFQEAEHSV